MVKRWALVLLLPALLGATSALITRPVVDDSGVLSSSDIEDVARELVRLRTATAVQMAVLVVSSTGGEPIEDYAIRAAEVWNGGRAAKDDGLLLVVAVEDRRMRLEVGYGLEEYLPDDAVRTLLDAQGPLMRQRDYRGALLAIVQGVGTRLPGGEDAWQPPPQVEPLTMRNTLIGLLVAGLAAGLLLRWCIGPWREQLGPVRLAASIGALLLVPSAITALVVHRFPVPTHHFLLAYLAFTGVFLGIALVMRHLSVRLAAVLWASPLLGCGLPLYELNIPDVPRLLLTSGMNSLKFAAGLAILTWPPILNIVLQLALSDAFSSGTSYSSGGSSSGGSSSGGSSSGSSWGGGGGSFGGGGASSSW